jgi:hypothetical protein
MLVSVFQHENTMKAAVLALVITWAALLPQTAAMAQTARAQRSEVSVIYGPPKDPAHQQIYEQLKEIGFLDKVGEFISPVLPRTLLVKLEGCDGDANASLRSIPRYVYVRRTTTTAVQLSRPLDSEITSDREYFAFELRRWDRGCPCSGGR